MEVLLVSTNKIDRSVLETFKKGLENNGIKSYTMIEIVHVSLTAYDWDRGVFNASKVIEILSSRVPSLSGMLIFGLFSPEMEYGDERPECIVRGNLFLLSIGNMRKNGMTDLFTYIKNNINKFIQGNNCYIIS
ncbi:hypothetical protein L3N51_00005 [Metallosphaera sp. J1]|uniref:hypothetical protein n=1 Tax=Metallosphaera javensis (ex Hofmann et al. 2022) TaxID=99938 RepID=UPI001EDF0530|nr:hypothetical protein [Metallosphaera javensis (ex Hofmann et al. 2022)]MCG3107741.1 hypothetical protein [Metallosphaera javensis (ex Hofmann et al. 2022)]